MTRTLRLVAPAAIVLLTALPAAPALAYTTTPGSDLSVTAQPIHGKVDPTKVVSIPTVFENLGPDATVAGSVTIEIVAPGGTEIEADVFADVSCSTKTPQHLVCTPDKSFPANQPMNDPLPIVIKSAHTTPGWVKYTCACDPDTKNNTAALVVTVTGASPSHHPTPKPTATHTTAAPHPSATPSTAPTPPDATTPSPQPASSPGAAGGPGANASPTDVALRTSSKGSGAGIYLAVAAVLVIALVAAAVIRRRRRGPASTA
jgi:hypothetical protein